MSETPGEVHIDSGEWPCFTATHHRIATPGEAAAAMGPGGFSIALAPVQGLTYRVEGRAAESVNIDPGTILINGSRPVTWLRWDSPLECIRVELSPERLARLAGAGRIGGETMQVVQDDMLLHIGMLLKNAIHEGDASGCVFAQSVGAALIAHIDRRYGAESGHADSIPGERLSPGVLRRVRDLIENRLAEPLRLQELAQTANVSEFHFIRAFKRSTGRSPHQYITARRMERAQFLLTTTDLPVAEVAWQVGFSNTSHFTAQFRKHTGMTPALWRESHMALRAAVPATNSLIEPRDREGADLRPRRDFQGSTRNLPAV